MPTQGNDDLYNNPALDYQEIDALGGDDTITIKRSNFLRAEVTVYGRDGNDTVDVTNETTVTVNVYGGNGVDTVIVKPIAGSYIIDVTPYQITLGGIDDLPADNPVVYYNEVERLDVSGMGDTRYGDRISWTTGDTQDKITVQGTRDELPIDIWSGGGIDEIRLNGPVGDGSRVNAGDGNDFVYGSGGHDILWGGAGEDNLQGGGGNDILVGGGARDLLYGGGGSDIFKYESVQDSGGPGGIDTIYDFVRWVDKIDLRGAGGYFWIGGAPFSGVAGQIKGTMLGIQVDANGDKLADMTIFVNGHYGGFTLTVSDFIL